MRDVFRQRLAVGPHEPRQSLTPGLELDRELLISLLAGDGHGRRPGSVLGIEEIARYSFSGSRP